MANIFITTLNTTITDVGALQGVKVAVQDNICVEQTRTTGGSKMLADFIAPYSATAVHKLLAAGATIVGKTNLRELGLAEAEPALGAVQNPVNPDAPIVGAAVGAAAAVAQKSVSAAVASDSTGDVRLSAASCNLVGFKPSYGRISRLGLMAYSGSMDQIGVISDSVAKTAQVAQVLAGHDPKDNTTWDEAAPEYSALMGKDLSGLTVGLANNYAKLGQNSAIWADLPAKLQAAGATVVAVELPDPALVNATFSIIASCEATSNFSRYDGLYYTHKSAEARTLLEKYSKSRGEGFGAEVKKQILLGNYYLTGANYQEYYMQALRQRTVIAQDFATALAKCAVVLTPTMVADATMPANSLTAGVNLAGAAAISVPVAGTNVQIISAPAAESQLFQVAAHIAGLN